MDNGLHRQYINVKLWCIHKFSITLVIEQKYWIMLLQLYVTLVGVQPNNDEVFKSILGNELDDISHFRHLIGEYRLAKGVILLWKNRTIETSETIKIAGQDAQKLVYTEPRK
jgi:hypothetical protein